MEVKGKPVTDLSNDKRLCDLALMMDMVKCQSELTIKLQGNNLLLSSLLYHEKSFEAQVNLQEM